MRTLHFYVTLLNFGMLFGCGSLPLGGAQTSVVTNATNAAAYQLYSAVFDSTKQGAHAAMVEVFGRQTFSQARLALPAAAALPAELSRALDGRYHSIAGLLKVVKAQPAMVSAQDFSAAARALARNEKLTPKVGAEMFVNLNLMGLLARGSSPTALASLGLGLAGGPEDASELPEGLKEALAIYACHTKTYMCFNKEPGEGLSAFKQSNCGPGMVYTQHDKDATGARYESYRAVIKPGDVSGRTCTTALDPYKPLTIVQEGQINDFLRQARTAAASFGLGELAEPSEVADAPLSQ